MSHALLSYGAVPCAFSVLSLLHADHLPVGERALGYGVGVFLPRAGLQLSLHCRALLAALTRLLIEYGTAAVYSSGTAMLSSGCMHCLV
jgi:hypothetical protein